jgi:hypothetical protein
LGFSTSIRQKRRNIEKPVTQQNPLAYAAHHRLGYPFAGHGIVQLRNHNRNGNNLNNDYYNNPHDYDS